LACLPDAHNAVMSCSEAPLLLSLVCSRWKFLVYSTPRLWASVHIAFPSFRILPPVRSPETAKYYEVCDDRVGKHQAAVQAWLARSGSCPLSISFHAPLDPWPWADFAQTISAGYLDIMLCFSHRWRILDINIPYGNPYNILTSIPTTSVPILKDLHLKFSSELLFTDVIEEWRASGLLHAPQLRTLDILDIPFSPASAPSISWSHLSSLNLKYNPRYRTPIHDHLFPTIQEVYAIFNRCTRLIHCTLDIFAGDTFGGAIPIGMISLPFLKTLDIFESSSSMSAVFECMSDLSALRGISYQTRTRASYRQTSSLVTLLTRTNNQITYLSTHLQSFTLADLKTIFSLVPNLTHLVDAVPPPSAPYRPYLPESFNLFRLSLELLAPLSSGEIYCPHLQVLHLNKTDELSDANILSFLQRRMGASQCSSGDIHPLREFHAIYSRPMEMDIQEQLSDYIDNGTLSLNIVYDIRTGLDDSDNVQIDPHNALVKRPVTAMIQACRS
jgi:hypothetical protein